MSLPNPRKRATTLTDAAARRVQRPAPLRQAVYDAIVDLIVQGTLQRGQFNRTAGTVTLDSVQERGELNIVIDASSLRASNAAATRFLRGPSMLDTEAHPEIAYRAGHIVFAHGKPARIEKGFEERRANGVEFRPEIDLAAVVAP